jgi:hypothetical protein
MKVIIKKSLDLVVDIPDDKIKSFFSENMSESDFIYWADTNMYLECPDLEDSNKDSSGPQIEAWVNSESTQGIIIEGSKLSSLKRKYTKKDIIKINDERDRIERCEDCCAVGDDYYTDKDGNMQSSCTNCPFSNYD